MASFVLDLSYISQNTFGETEFGFCLLMKNTDMISVLFADFLKRDVLQQQE